MIVTMLKREKKKEEIKMATMETMKNYSTSD